MAAAQAAAGGLGAAGWVVAELLLAVRTGMAAGVATNRAATAETTGRTGDG